MINGRTKPDSKGRCRIIFVLCLAVVSTFSAAGKPAVQDQDTQRKIVSDDFVKGRRQGRNHPNAKSRVASKSRRAYRLASNPVKQSERIAAGAPKQLGITIWRLRSARSGDSDRRALIREKGKGTVWVAERVESEAILRAGEYIRLTVESPSNGYLYVIDRDVLADGANGVAKLIFPWSGADNRLAPGRLIDIPRQEDDPSYFTASLTSENQVGELLTFIVTTNPLVVPVADEALPVASKDVTEWERLWGGPTERYEMEGGAGAVWTLEEQRAAAQRRRTQLTRDDPAPQTVYRVYTSNGKGVLVNLQLKYRK